VLRISARRRDAAVEFCVADQGPGIAAHQLGQVFVRYWRARGRRSELGLGLYIAERIVVAHGGRIWAENTPEPGRGAWFFFTLPVLDSALPAREPTSRGVSAGADRGKPLA
jgi:signal transduction histidine kinase